MMDFVNFLLLNRLIVYPLLSRLCTDMFYFHVNDLVKKKEGLVTSH